MAFGRNGNNGGKGGSKWGNARGQQKSRFTRVGNLFKSKHPKEGILSQYYTSVEGKYLDAVVEAINKHAQEVGSVSFSIVRYTDSEYPVLSVSAGKPKDSKAIRRSKNDSFHDTQEQNDEQEEVGL